MSRVTYVGHATLLLELGGARILTDPNFDARLGGVLPRVCPPGLPLAELCDLDAVLITHAHADHLSFTSLRQLPADVPLYAPPVVARWLRRLGYSQALPIAPGEVVSIAHVRLRAAAARHVGSRYGVDRWRGAANMYLLDSMKMSILFAGDTGLKSAVWDQVRDEFGSTSRLLDVALLPIGQPPWWKRGLFRRGHLTPSDALAAFERLRARYFIPYHWGTFRHLTSTPFSAMAELERQLHAYSRAADVVVLQPGSSFHVSTE